MYFVDGAFRLRIEDEVMDMAPGSFAFVPRDTPHSWQNVSEGQAHMLFVFTPASPGMERFFERFAEVAGERIGCAGGLHGARGGRGHDRPRPSAGAVAPDLTWCRSLGTSCILVPKSAYIRAHPDTSDPEIDADSCLRTPRFAIRRSAVRARLAPSLLSGLSWVGLAPDVVRLRGLSEPWEVPRRDCEHRVEELLPRLAIQTLGDRDPGLLCVLQYCWSYSPAKRAERLA